jgi:hypothetical protein
MTPVVIHTGETISPVEGTERDFTNPVTYTVKAADGTSRDYTVTVNVAASDAKAITAFYFTFGGKKYGAGTGTETNSGNISGNTITITVPYGTTNLASLTPTVTHSWTLISPDGATWGSSPSPHTYTVTAEDGTSQDYTVTVNVAKIASVTAVNGNFTSPNGFVKTGSDISDEITDAITSVTGTDGLGTAITLAPADYSVDTLNPASAGANATATLRVPAAKNSTGGDITKTFTVYIKNDAKAITAFAIDSPVSAVGTIDEAAKTITVSVPYGTNVAAMTATASYTGDSISPDPAAADYTGGKTFTVTVEDGTTRTYTVTVNATPRITISGITVEGLSALTFSGVPASPVSASTSITITISGGVTVDSWHIEIKGPAPSTSPVGTFAAPPVPGFYNINVFATVGGNLYSGSFGLIVN